MNSKQRRTDRRLDNAFERGWSLINKSNPKYEDIKYLLKIVAKRFKLRRSNKN